MLGAELRAIDQVNAYQTTIADTRNVLGRVLSLTARAESPVEACHCRRGMLCTSSSQVTDIICCEAAGHITLGWGQIVRRLRV